MTNRPINHRFHWAWLVSLAISTIPALVILAFILHYGVNMPHYDQWQCEAPIFKKFLEHQLTFADLWAQHNEHRMFFPRLVYLPLAYFTHWNVKAELIATWLCVCIVSFSVYRMHRNVSGPISAPEMIPFIAANVLIFSPASVDAWLWGVSLANLLPMACIIGAMAVACSNRPPNRRLGLCAVLATIATFSTASGLLCWILCAPLLFLRTDPPRWRKWRRWPVLAWTGGFILTTTAYFYHYTRPAHHPPPTESLQHPLDMLSFLLLYQGNPLTFLTQNDYFLLRQDNPLTFFTQTDYFLIARIIGGTMLTLMMLAGGYLLYRWHDDQLRDRALIWTILGAYSIGNGILIAVSRMGIGIGAAVWTRYASYALLLPVALIFLLPLLAEDLAQRSSRWNIRPMATAVLRALLIAALTLHIFKFPESVQGFERFQANLLHRKAALLFIDVIHQDSPRLMGEASEEEMRGAADFLNAHAWLHPPLIKRARMQDIEDSSVTDSDAYGKIEQAGDAGNGKTAIIGWACNPRTRSPADAMVLSWEQPGGDAVPFAIADMGLKHPGEPGGSSLRSSNWQVAFPSTILPAGKLDIRAWSLDTSRGKAVRLRGVFRPNILPRPPTGP